MKARRFFAVVVTLVTLMTAAAFADGLTGDVDSDALSGTPANGTTASQDVGTSHAYDYSTAVKETGNATNDVFVNLGDKVTVTVTIEQNDLAWPAGISASSLLLTSYTESKNGLLNVTVPAGTPDGTQNHIQLKLSGVASNGQSLSPSDVRLNYTITAHAVECAPAYTVDFLPPFDDSTPQGLIVNTMKSGRTVPVKVTILDLCTGDYVTSGLVSIGVAKSNNADGSSSDPVETYSDSGQSSDQTSLFRWSPDASIPLTKGGGFWIYNLDSKTAGTAGSALAVGTIYRINAYLGTQIVTGTDWALLKPMK